MSSEMRAIRSRLDFSKIPTSIQIPNLIEVQRRSYERFLQMDKLPQEREDNGLQSVFTSVFPITDFRNVSELEFVDFSIGNWECKCGYLKGLNHLRTACTNCGHMVITDPFHPGDVLCNFCGTYNKNTPDFCTKCGDPVGLQLKYDQAECEERGMTYSAPLKVTIRLKIYDKDPETGVKSLRDMKEQEVFFGDIPLMTPERHLHRQRHRARHRLAAAPFARRLLRDGEQPHLLPRQDHPVPRQLGGVRVRPEEHPLRPHRPQAQVPRHHLPARARPAHRRGDPQDLLHRRHHQREGRQAAAGRSRPKAQPTNLQGTRPAARHHRQG